MSKNALIKGTIVLTIASLITRVLGVAQRIPLQRILGDQGMATYGIAYNIYGILLIVATLGLPSALSKQIAEFQAQGKYHEAGQTYRASLAFAIAAGVLAAIVLYLAAPYYAVYISRDPVATASIRAIAPALLVFPAISIMRGYFQGMQVMLPTGLSQISEQILRVGTAVLLPLVFLQLGYSNETVIAGASFGAVAGSIGAIGIMIFFYFRTRTVRARKRELREQTAYETLRKGQIFRQLMKTAIPISLASTAIPLIYFIDSSTVIALLKQSIGYDEAKNLLGILTGRAQSLAGIPPILAIALSSAVLPAVAGAFARKNLGEVGRMGSLSLRLTLITGAPVALYLTGAAFAVNGFLFSDAEGSWIVAFLCFGSIFQILMMTSMAILQGVGKSSLPMWYVFAGVAGKFVCNMIFTPLLGIYGVILSTTICFIIILSLNIRAIRKMVTLNMMGTRWRGFLLASVAMILVEWLTCYGLRGVILPDLPRVVGFGLLSGLTALIGFVVYFWLLLRSGGMTEEDLGALPSRVKRLVDKGRKVGVLPKTHVG